MRNSPGNTFEAETDTGTCLRIKNLRKMLNLSQKEFSSKIGISQGHLCVIEKGAHPPSGTLIMAICHRFGVNEAWLIAGTGEPLRTEQNQSGIPVFSHLPDNYPDTPLAGEILGYMSLPNLPAKGFAFYQRGDYMAPTIQANDLMIFERVEKIENEDIVLVKNKWNTWIVRRYRSSGDSSMFTADNTAYKSFQYDLEKQDLLARVRFVMRNVNF